LAIGKALEGNRMKAALNSLSAQVIAAVILLVCAAALTKECAQQMHVGVRQSNMISTAPGVQK
jgi:hypothetical protein